MNANREKILDNGQLLPEFANSVQRAFSVGMLGLSGSSPSFEMLGHLEMTDGWLSVAAAVQAMYMASEGADQNYTPAELASLLYRAYHRGMTGDDPTIEYADRPTRERLCWEAAARHATWLIQATTEDLRELQDYEAKWGDWIIKSARNRGAILEPVEYAAAPADSSA